MTVDAYFGLADTGDFPEYAGYQAAELFGNRIPDGIGYIQGRSSGVYKTASSI
jgi:hypothetical protein